MSGSSRSTRLGDVARLGAGKAESNSHRTSTRSTKPSPHSFAATTGRLLLDTHVPLWWLAAEHLRPKAVAAIASTDSDVWVSAGTVWAMSIKAGLGKLAVPDDLSDQLTHHGFDILPIELPHALALRSLPPHHADPFDRMLVAQAQTEDLTVVTRDANIRRYAVAVLRA